MSRRLVALVAGFADTCAGRYPVRSLRTRSERVGQIQLQGLE